LDTWTAKIFDPGLEAAVQISRMGLETNATRGFLWIVLEIKFWSLVVFALRGSSASFDLQVMVTISLRMAALFAILSPPPTSVAANSMHSETENPHNFVQRTADSACFSMPPT